MSVAFNNFLKTGPVLVLVIHFCCVFKISDHDILKYHLKSDSSSKRNTTYFILSSMVVNLPIYLTYFFSSFLLFLLFIPTDANIRNVLENISSLGGATEMKFRFCSLIFKLHFKYSLWKTKSSFLLSPSNFYCRPVPYGGQNRSFNFETYSIRLSWRCARIKTKNPP